MSALLVAVLIYAAVVLAIRGYPAIGFGVTAVAGFVLATAVSVAFKASGSARGTRLADWWVRQSANPYSTAYACWVFAATLCAVALLLESDLSGTPQDPGYHGLAVFLVIAATVAAIGVWAYHRAKRSGTT